MTKGRLRLNWRSSKYFLWSIRNSHFSGARAALLSLAKETSLNLQDFCLHRKQVECNLCGWQGIGFYPNVGSGYFELDTTCPRCWCIHRYRALLAVLETETQFFSPDKEVIEVAPVKAFQAYCLWRKSGKCYRSFDLERFAMERGDITSMHYAENSCDYFLCFHVLEHVPADSKALQEIFRVLRPGGVAVLQVPIDHSLSETVEYGGPNIFETGHVRRYAENGFAGKLIEQDFRVHKLSVDDLFPESDILRYGFDREPIYFATKPH